MLNIQKMYNDTTKGYIMKWRASHLDQYRTYIRGKVAEYRAANREKVNERSKELYRKKKLFQKEALVFRMIMLN